MGGKLSTSEQIIKNVLREFGLTDAEMEVYVFLSRHQALKGGDIARGLNAHRAEVYRALKGLQSSGMVEKTLDSPGYFVAVSFDKVIDLRIKAKMREASVLKAEKSTLLSNWEHVSKARLESPLERFVVIEGDDKIYPRIFQMIENAKEEILVVLSGSTFIRASQVEIDKLIFGKAKERGIRARVLTQMSDENLGFLKQSAAIVFENELSDQVQARHLEADLRLYTRFIVRDEDEALFFIRTVEGLSTVNRKEACLWTNCRAVIDILRGFFEELWLDSIDMAKKIGKAK